MGGVCVARSVVCLEMGCGLFVVGSYCLVCSVQDVGSGWCISVGLRVGGASCHWTVICTCVVWGEQGVMFEGVCSVFGALIV